MDRLTAAEFNARYPVGTPVLRYPIITPRAGTPIVTRTRSEAWTLGHGAVVVSVKGLTGGQSLDALVVITEAEYAAKAKEQGNG